MSIQEIPLELDKLLRKGGLVFWQASNNRKSITVISPWAKDVLGEKADTISGQDDWFDSIHARDVGKVKKTVAGNDGKEVYQLDYRWANSPDSYVWLRELGRRKAPGSNEFEGLLFTIDEQKKLEHKILDISEREKRKLGRELHDDLCQQLAGLLFFTNNLVYQIKAGKDPDTLIEATTEIKKQLQLSIEKTRSLSRGLNPVNLDRKTFQESLIELIQQSQTLYSVNCPIQMSSGFTLSNPELTTHLFRITQESINNAVRHGGADTISITLQKDGNFGILEIRDNGSGFQSDPHNAEGMGLHNLRSRARMIKASIEFCNDDRGGASVHCRFPLPKN